MSDTIYREAAIDAVAEGLKNTFIEYRDVAEKMIGKLPSAQSEPSTAIQEILNYLDTTLHPIVSTDNWYAYAELYDMVSSLSPTQPELKWIPCSERLPKEEERRYWVCTDTGYQCQCRWTNDVYGFGVSDRWEWKIYDIPQYQKVVAWMSLPEPYREEGGE